MSDLKVTADLARELCLLGDALYWKFKLLKIVLENYKAVAKIKTRYEST